MSKNYAHGLPHDRDGNALQEFPAPKTALVTTAAVTNISSVFAMGNSSTSIEIGAPGTAIAIKWISSTASQTSVISSYFAAANFDHIIPAGTVRRLVIPQETAGIAGPALANSVYGLYQRLAAVPINGVAAASILVTEY